MLTSTMHQTNICQQNEKKDEWQRENLSSCSNFTISPYLMQ